MTAKPEMTDELEAVPSERHQYKVGPYGYQCQRCGQIWHEANGIEQNPKCRASQAVTPAEPAGASEVAQGVDFALAVDMLRAYVECVKKHAAHELEAWHYLPQVEGMADDIAALSQPAAAASDAAKPTFYVHRDTLDRAARMSARTPDDSDFVVRYPVGFPNWVSPAIQSNYIPLYTHPAPDVAKDAAALLIEALDKIASFAVGYGDVCEIIAKTARAALREYDAAMAHAAPGAKE